tara:strand:- start:35 stop:952 length:918 start_codon:yes stop_codon:yes gene_type:complete
MEEIKLSKEKLNNIKISIGLAIYNEEKNITNILKAILNQSHKNFELIISDDCSKDNTVKICKNFKMNDDRIKLYEQKTNVGVAKNFEFVFKKSTSDYFIWLAGDDLITFDYLEENLRTLKENENCVFAASPHCFKGDENNENKKFTFSIKGSLYEKGKFFLKNCFNATGCNFAIFKKEILKTVPEMEKKFLGHDWKVLCHSLSKGEFVRSKKGLLILGREGLSASPDFMGKEAKKISEHILPMIEFSKFFFKTYIVSKKINSIEKIILFYLLARINLWFVFLKYLNIIKKIIKKTNHPKLGDAYK